MKSGVPQDSVLGPLFFLIYINDIDDVVSLKLLKFVDDMKVFGVVSNSNDIEKLQIDFMNLCKWSEDWLMFFNADKCKIMHFGYNNNMANYKLNDKNLEVRWPRKSEILVQSRRMI